MTVDWFRFRIVYTFYIKIYPFSHWLIDCQIELIVNFYRTNGVRTSTFAKLTSNIHSIFTLKLLIGITVTTKALKTLFYLKKLYTRRVLIQTWDQPQSTSRVLETGPHQKNKAFFLTSDVIILGFTHCESYKEEFDRDPLKNVSFVIPRIRTRRDLAISSTLAKQLWFPSHVSSSNQVVCVLFTEVGFVYLHVMVNLFRWQIRRIPNSII